MMLKYAFFHHEQHNLNVPFPHYSAEVQEGKAHGCIKKLQKSSILIPN